MGYPVSYRTSAARAERRLSRPVGAAAPQDNKPFNRSPANDPVKPWYNRDPGLPFDPDPGKPFPRPKGRSPIPKFEPPRLGDWVKHPAVRRFAIIGMQVHPWYRILRGLWKAYELYNWWKVVNTSTGDYSLACSVDPATGCTDMVPCSGSSYCSGPAFQQGNFPGTLCGLGGQANSSKGTWQNTPTGFPGGGNQGQIVFFNRPAPFCHPGRVVQVWHHVGSAPNSGRKRFEPQQVPFVKFVPRPIAPFRWFYPELVPPGQLEGDISPLPPPYPMIPTRPMGNSERGNSVGTSKEDEFYYPRRPPGTRVKEKKVRFNGAAGVLHAVLVSLAQVHGKLADLRDILGAMNDALPKELQLKGKAKKQIPELLRNIYANLDKMDGAKALAGIIKEIAEDVVGGAGAQLRAETAKNFGWLSNKVYTSPRF